MNQLPQSQLNKVLELLKLPQDMEVFTGQINQCTRYALVENRLIDKTYVNENFKRVDKVTSEFVSLPKTIELGVYNHNLLSAYVHSYNLDPIGFIGSAYRMNKDGVELTITTGPFSGKTYHFSWQEVTITPTTDGFDMRVETEPWMNTQSNGLPALDQRVSIERRTTTKIGSVSIIPSKQQVTVTNVRLAGPVKDYPSYTKTELEAKTGWDEYQIAEAMATVFHMKTKNVDTHCVALGTDIEINDKALTGVVYINGAKSKEINFRSLISSYNKPLPDFVTRWKVYHPSKTDGSIAYGTALPVIQNTSTEDNTINIVKGAALGYDNATRTLTYIDGTTLVFDFEFLPAQGKNETWGSVITLDDLQEDIYG
jgi:hypothetical protein